MMKQRLRIMVLVVPGLTICALLYGEVGYRWLPDDMSGRGIGTSTGRNIANAIPVPAGFERIPVPGDSFGAWLRHLPLKPPGTFVLLYNGTRKGNQDAHHAVLDIDTGARDLQQCADAVIRLRAEYLYAASRLAEIHFKFTSGDVASFTRWADGFRPLVAKDRVRWIKRAQADSSYTSFRRFLGVVFSYAGTLSLSRELVARPIKGIEIGDLFIRGGSPGHAAIVVDLAVDKATGRKVFLLAQSYMPAQDIHILKNPVDPKLSPWYPVDFGEILETPEWIFKKGELMRFPQEGESGSPQAGARRAASGQNDKVPTSQKVSKSKNPQTKTPKP